MTEEFRVRSREAAKKVPQWIEEGDFASLSKFLTDQGYAGSPTKDDFMLVAHKAGRVSLKVLADTWKPGEPV